jgi:hypothetical protein
MKEIVNLKTPKGVNLCLQYVGNGNNNEDRKQDFNIFTKMIKETKFKAKYLRTGHYFPEDHESRDIWKITIKRNGKTISFNFGSSLVDTWENKEPQLYDILSIVQLDYSYGQQSFEDFCGELDLDTDSIKANKMYKECVKHSEKLAKIFSEIETYSMPQ